MKITRSICRNFRGFRDFSMPLSANATFVIAMNGVGKTSVIEGLAAAIGGFKKSILHDASRSKPKLDRLLDESDYRRAWLPDQRGFYTETELTIESSAEWEGTKVSWRLTSYSPETESPRRVNPKIEWFEETNEFADKLRPAAKDNEIILPLLMALRAKRLKRGEKKTIAPYAQRTSAPPERLAAWANCLYFEKDWYTVREEWLTLQDDQRFGGQRATAANASISSALMAALELEDPPSWSPEEHDFVLALRDDGPRVVGLMSDGWRAYVTMIVGLAMHCAEINPMRANAPEITPGVLLIDELEQHLHPHLQLEIVDGLRAAFPLLQIIATTHSPLILTDAVGDAGNSIIRLDRNEGGEIVANTLGAPEGQNVLQVLTGDWFGLSTTYDDETLRMLAEHRELMRGGPNKREEARALAARLRERLGHYANTSVEEMVLSIVAELEQDTRFHKLSHEQIRDLRANVLAKIKAQLP